MAVESISTGICNKFIDLLVRGTSWTPITTAYIQLHFDHPGSAGTGSPCSNSTRKALVFGNASASAQGANTGINNWNPTGFAEAYNYFTAWDSLTSGGSNQFLFSGGVTPITVGAADSFSFNAGAITLSFTPAS